MNTVGASRAWRLLASAVFGLALATLAGCGGQAASTATVSGKVSYKGAPLTGGLLTLYPASGAPVPISIGPDGAFSSSGAPTGLTGVGIDTSGVLDPSKLPPGATPPSPDELSKMAKKVEIPLKYKNPKTSGLTWDLKPGKNTNNFDLTD